MIVFAITRWPGLMPPNFSAAYALVFCAGVYFRNRLGWQVPLAIMLLSDLALNVYYTFFAEPRFNAFQPYLLFNYLAYTVIFWLGRRFRPQSNFFALIGGGLAGAVIFYLVTNTAAWFFNPFANAEYEHSVESLLLALTFGTGHWPSTFEFFRNSLLSSGLFTALFIAALRVSEHLESAAEKKAAEATEESGEQEPEAQPEEA
jgi:hypothetical protein